MTIMSITSTKRKEVGGIAIRLVGVLVTFCSVLEAHIPWSPNSLSLANVLVVRGCDATADACTTATANCNDRHCARAYTSKLMLRPHPKRKFTGKERDAETGLDYFGARYMSAAQGRFTSPDVPLLDQQPGDPQSWNLYTYVRNNPLVFTDPIGNDCVDVNSGGNGIDSINNQNTSQDCGRTGGYWVDGTVTQARFAHGSLILTGTTDGTNLTSASYGLGSDPGLMALQRAGQIASPVTQPKTIAAFYVASAAVGDGGMQLAGRLGYAELQSLGRIIPEIASTPGHLGAVSRTAAQGGTKAVEKFLRGQLKALAEHEEELVRYRAEGGYTSQVEGTIRNVKGLIKAATDWLSKNP